MGMYESPIKLYMTDVQTQLIKKQEEQILQAVQNVAVGIDREDLFRALQYDRGQYEKGRMDAIMEMDLVKVVRCKDCVWCHECEDLNYCENPNAPWIDDPDFDDVTVADNDFCSYGERHYDGK